MHGRNISSPRFCKSGLIIHAFDATNGSKKRMAGVSWSISALVMRVAKEGQPCFENSCNPKASRRVRTTGEQRDGILPQRMFLLYVSISSLSYYFSAPCLCGKCGEVRLLSTAWTRGNDGGCLV